MDEFWEDPGCQVVLVGLGLIYVGWSNTLQSRMGIDIPGAAITGIGLVLFFHWIFPLIGRALRERLQQRKWRHLADQLHLNDEERQLLDNDFQGRVVVAIICLAIDKVVQEHGVENDEVIPVIALSILDRLIAEEGFDRAHQLMGIAVRTRNLHQEWEQYIEEGDDW